MVDLAFGCASGCDTIVCTADECGELVFDFVLVLGIEVWLD